MSASQAEEIAGVRPILRRVVTNAGMLLGGRTVNAVLSLAYMAIAARALGVRELGVLVLIQAFAQFLGDVVKFQSWQTIIHYGAQPLERGETHRLPAGAALHLIAGPRQHRAGHRRRHGGSFLFAGRWAGRRRRRRARRCSC
jgi:hypothetical protein